MAEWIPKLPLSPGEGGGEGHCVSLKPLTLTLSHGERGQRSVNEYWISRESRADYRRYAESWPRQCAGLCRRRSAPAALYAAEHGVAGRDRTPGCPIWGESCDGPV